MDGTSRRPEDMPAKRDAAQHAKEGGARCPAFDGLRGVGIAAILLHHQEIRLFAHAHIFLDMFFVLSGFLITYLLVREHEKYGAVSFKAFWQRRLLRITPLYVLYTSILTVGVLFGGFELDGDVARYLELLWLYALNFGASIDQYITFRGWDISAFLWSLALEEQFYLAWPFLCVILLRGPRALRLVIPSMIVFQLVSIRLAQTHQEVGFLPWTRGLGMTMGSGAALLLHWYPSLVRFLRVPWVQAGSAAIIVATLAALQLVDPLPDEFITVKYIVPPLMIPLTLMCTSLWYDRETRLHRGLSWKPILYLGKISYGLYIWHSLAFALTGLVVALPGVWQCIPELLSALAMGALSHRYFELPFLRIKERLSAPPRVRPASLVAPPSSRVAHSGGVPSVREL